MKIRKRLIIAFLIMILFPVAITLLSISIILGKQNDTLSDSYNVNQKNYSSLDMVLNPFNFFYNITYSDYTRLKDVIDEDPNKFLQTDFLEQENQNLIRKKTFLVVIQNGTYYYIGNQEALDNISSLPLSSDYSKDSKYLTYIDQKSSSIIREVSFLYSDNSHGQFFLITNYSDFIPQWGQSIKEILIAFFFVLIITAILLTFWIYESILRPLNILRIATMQIGAGNLEQPITNVTDDEIGQLCQDFDDMRIRLKSMIEDSIAAEENTREIMSSISHDLKTPITAIKGYTEGILDGVADTPEKQKKYLQTIYAKANDITYLIDELSLFSKAERNSLVYNFIAVNLEDYFTDCISDISLDLESQNITVEYENDTDKETMVLADTEQLKRVLHNIIDNAVKYIDKPDGHIRIHITNVIPEPEAPPLYRQLKKDGTDLVPPHTPDEYVQIEITDNGPGIEEKDLPHIFERFYRADASRNSSKRGSGIGLSIVRLIITEHGGKVWAESTKGMGSSFYFTLKKETQHNNLHTTNNGGDYE